jgi:ketosteroid isomerase-like protein
MQMVKIKNLLTVFAAILFLLEFGAAQSKDRRRVTAQSGTTSAFEDRCDLNGTYRIDVADSDGLYAVVKNARSTVPFADQQQFFMDLSTRLTPPDMLAIECRGRRVSVGSSRASKITYVADGKNHRERLAGGSYVNSKITLDKESLTFVSVGDVEDNVNVAFEALDGGKRMSVTRRIYAKQLPEPIIIQTFYDKISPAVEWKLYDGSLVAEKAAGSQARVVNRPDNSSRRDRGDELRNEFSAWLDATNRRDINRQMRFYMPELKAYYLSRNTPQRAVRLEKEKVFGAARSVDIRAGEPEIVFQHDGRTAVMRFVKDYRVAEKSRTRQGAVIQELRWQHTNDGWKIFSERDVRVIR